LIAAKSRCFKAVIIFSVVLFIFLVV
jgi:hypothetical protein